MSNSTGKDIALVIHGAFQSHKNVAGAELLLRDLGFKEVHMPNLAGHGAENDIKTSEKSLTERLTEDLLSRQQIKQSLDVETIGRVILIGHSLGASVALAIAKQLAMKAKYLNLILVEPIFWLGKKCDGQDDLLNNLETHIPQNKTQIEITNYLKELLNGDHCASEEISTLAKLAKSSKVWITLIRGGRKSIQSKKEFKIELSDRVLPQSIRGQEIGSLVPDDYCDRELFDNQLVIKQAGHNPFIHTCFYRWLKLVACQI